MNRQHRRRLLTLAVAMTLVLGACGGSESEGEPPTDSTETGTETGTAAEGQSNSEAASSGGDVADLERAATEMFLAYTSGDFQTYFDYLSSSCRERLGFAAVDSHLSGRRFRAEGADIDLSTLGVSSVEIDDSSGGSAYVTLILSGTEETFEESIPNYWIYEDGSWHKDDCSNITESQGGLEGYGTDRNDPVPDGGVAEVNGWLLAVYWVAPDDETTMVELGAQPAADGNQLFSVQLNPSYNGSKASTTLGEDVAFALVNGSNVYGDESDCASDNSAFIDFDAQVGPGDGLGFVSLCRQVVPADANGMLLRATDLASGTEYWFDLNDSG